MYKLLFTSFFRTRIFLVSLALLLTLGIVSLFIGRQYLVKQEKAIAAAEQFQKESIDRNVEYHGEDLGLLLYYLRFTLIKQPENLSAVSIGQSDVNPLLQAVTIRGLEGQKYDSDFENPSLLVSGNLDLGFVIIYLFPLVLIAMTYNLYSEEKELGTWRILASQTNAKVSFLLKKLAVRIFFVLLVLVFLLFLAAAFLQIGLDSHFWALFLQSVLYVLFWGALCLLVVSFQKGSSINALSLISIWVVLTILIPATVNNYVINAYQVPEALNAMLEQRDGYHEKWDLEKDAAMKGFLKEYPQYSGLPVPEDRFSWLWYYAMQHNGDMESFATSQDMRAKIVERNRVSESVALFVPTMHAQLNFNKLAGTDMIGHLNYLDELTDYHAELREGFYPKVFSEKTAEAVDWTSHQAKRIDLKRDFSWWALLLPTALMTALIGILSLLKLREL